VGKTTVAELVVAQLSDAVLFDPEEVGFLLRRRVPVPTGDFQDLRAWRHLTAVAIVAIAQEHQAAAGRVDLVVPMSLTDATYRAEILGALDRAEVELHEFVLTAEPAELERRIENQELDPGDADRDRAARQWRLARVGPVSDRLSSLVPVPRFVDTTTLTPEQVTAAILQILSEVESQGG